MVQGKQILTESYDLGCVLDLKRKEKDMLLILRDLESNFPVQPMVAVANSAHLW